MRSGADDDAALKGRMPYARPTAESHGSQPNLFARSPDRGQVAVVDRRLAAVGTERPPTNTRPAFVDAPIIVPFLPRAIHFRWLSDFAKFTLCAAFET